MKIRNQMKKWIALLCVLAMVFSFVPSAFADGETDSPDSTPAVSDPAPAQDAPPTSNPAPAQDAAPTSNTAPAQESAPAPAANTAPAQDAAPAPATNTAPAQNAAPTSNTAPAQDAAPAPAADPAPSAPTQEAASNSVAEPIQVSTVEEYQSLDPLPTEPVITQTEETVETKTVTNETTTPVSETVAVEQKTDTVTNEDGSTTITTEKTTTTTTESETTTTTETTKTTTDTYEVKSEGSYVTDSEEVAAYIAAQEEEKQKEIKADVEEKGGSYEYNVEITDKPSTEHIVDDETYDTHADAEPRVQKLKETENVDNQSIKIVPTKKEEERQADLKTLVGAATDLGGTINEDVTKVEQESTVIEATFYSLDKAQEFLNKASEVYKDQTLADKDNITVEDLKGKPQNEEDKGYTCEITDYVLDTKTWTYHQTLTITITGAGLDEIKKDFPEYSISGVEPGDAFELTVVIIDKTETEDEYVLEDYSLKHGGPFFTTYASLYDARVEEYGDEVGIKYGEVVDRSEDGRYVRIKPNSVDVYLDRYGKNFMVNWGSDNYMKYYCEQNGLDYYSYNHGFATRSEYEKVAKSIDAEKMLEFYNIKYGTNYTNYYDAFQANLWNSWTEYYGENEDPETFWKGKEQTKLSDLAKENIMKYQKLDGEIDNLYMLNSFGWSEYLVFKAVRNYKANLEIDDVNYKVEYDEINHTYEVEVAGLGTYTVKEEETETEETKLTVVDVKTETVVEKETVPPIPDEPVVPVIPNIPFFPAEIGNNPQGDLLEIDDFMTPLAGSLIMNEGDCIN